MDRFGRIHITQVVWESEKNTCPHNLMLMGSTCFLCEKRVHVIYNFIILYLIE